MQLMRLKKGNKDLGFFLKLGNQYIKIQFISDIETINNAKEEEYDFDNFGKGLIKKEINTNYIG